MAQYLISDLHLDHENIIEYCDRPFEDVEEMNDVLIKNWNDTVNPNDEVIFGGDLTVTGTAAAFLKWIERLNGEIVFIVGNHDRTVIKNSTGFILCNTTSFLQASMTSTVRIALRISRRIGTVGPSSVTIIITIPTLSPFLILNTAVSTSLSNSLITDQYTLRRSLTVLNATSDFQ